MVEEKKYVKLRWQNLIHKKCPACDSRLLIMPAGLECPGKRTNECAGNFFISKRKFAEVMTSPDHPAVRFMNPHEHEVLDQALTELGITDVKAWWRQPAINDKMGIPQEEVDRINEEFK